MKVFLGWSGQRSKEVAEALRGWLPDVLQSVRTPFLSNVDIETGKVPLSVLRDVLADSTFGIICLTKDNCRRPWLMFESGALAKVVDRPEVVDKPHLCPYLIDMEQEDLQGSPLEQFQAANSDEEGTWALIRALNGASDIISLDNTALRKTFDRWWPELEPKLQSEVKPLGPSAEAGFLLINVKTGGVLRAAGLPNKNGAAVELAPYSGDEQEIWRFHRFQKKYFAIVSPYTQQCLDVEGKSSSENAKIHQWEFKDRDNQKWALALQEDGSYKLRARHSGKYLALTDAGIKQLGDSNSRGQKWLVAPVFGA